MLLLCKMVFIVRRIFAEGPKTFSCPMGSDYIIQLELCNTMVKKRGWGGGGGVGGGGGWGGGGVGGGGGGGGETGHISLSLIHCLKVNVHVLSSLQSSTKNPSFGVSLEGFIWNVEDMFIILAKRQVNISELGTKLCIRIPISKEVGNSQ